MLSNLEITVHKKNPKAAKLQETEDRVLFACQKKNYQIIFKLDKL